MDMEYGMRAELKKELREKERVRVRCDVIIDNCKQMIR